VAETKTKKTYHLGTGRRTTAVARIRMVEGNGTIAINDRELNDYFTEDKDRAAVLGPLELCEMRNRLDVIINVTGGGYSGQAGAICQGIARALKDVFGLNEPAPSDVPADGQSEDGTPAAQGGMAKKLRDSGYLTRDGRMKERKKYGRKGARKAFQFSKR
jgi:small subunit ribosomal protein S9